MADSKEHLVNITSGATLTFVGTILALIFSSLCRIVIGRSYSVEDYGNFALCLTVISLVMTFALLGFPDSLAREIPYYKSIHASKVNELLSLSLLITVTSGILFGIALYFSSSFFANLFHNSNLIVYLQIMAVSIPFSVFIKMVITIYRGLGSAKEQVYFQNISQNLLFLLLLSCGIFIGWSFGFTYYGYLLSQIITAILLILYAHRLKIFTINLHNDFTVIKDLLALSVPLLFTNISFFLATWTDSIMIGIYMSSQDVGYYNVAFLFGQFLPVVLTSVAFLYLPFASELFDQNQRETFKQVFHTLSKWIFLCTFPFFCILLIFPDVIIEFFFGAAYLPAAQALQVLTIGYFIYVIFGLSCWNILILKQGRFILVTNIILTVVNILLNIVLIPKYGILGSALASISFYAGIGLLYTIRCYHLTGIHMFDKDYIIIIALCLALLCIVVLLPYKLIHIYALAALCIVLFGLSLLLAKVTRCINAEDVELLHVLYARILG